MVVSRCGRRGFTLIELLTVIAIIGVLATLAVVALNGARQRSRDVKRVSDIRQIQTALELGFSEVGGYPDSTGPIVLGSDAYDVMCVSDGPVFHGSAAGCITVLMGLVPSNPTPGGADYIYTSATGSGAYSLTFALEGQAGQFEAGANCASQIGIIAGSTC